MEVSGSVSRLLPSCSSLEGGRKINQFSTGEKMSFSDFILFLNDNVLVDTYWTLTADQFMSCLDRVRLETGLVVNLKASF